MGVVVLGGSDGSTGVGSIGGMSAVDGDVGGDVGNAVVVVGSTVLLISASDGALSVSLAGCTGLTVLVLAAGGSDNPGTPFSNLIEPREIAVVFVG